MRSAKIMACALGVLGVCSAARPVSAQTPERGKRIVIAASMVLDGKGGVLRDTRIVVEGAKIVAVETKADAKAWPVDLALV